MKTSYDHSALLELLNQPSRLEKSSLLVIRLRDVGRIALEYGQAHARHLEDQALTILRERASRVLRTDDLLIHEPGTGDILILLSPSRESERDALPMDARMILERLARVLENELQLQIERGWVMVDQLSDPSALQAAIQRALEWGGYERERYAFFAAIGHELRTPLTAICGYLETLNDETLTKKLRKRFLDIAYAESLRVNRLIDGMFHLSLMDLQTTAHQSEHCESNLALKAACEAVAATAQGLQAKFCFTPPAPAVVSIAFDRLVQMIVNLLSNALKYGPPQTSIEVHSRIEGLRVLHITVEDNGPGIAPQDRERIFRLGERASSHVPGSGIGLALVRLYAERAGGCVGIRDSALGGSCFWIRLPIVQPD